MKINKYRVLKQPNLKHVSKDPDTGNIKISAERYDRAHDEILELYQNQVISNK